MAPRIRPAAAADAPAALAVLHAAHAWNLAHGFNFTAATMRLDELAERLTPETFFVAEVDGRLVGTVEVKPEPAPGMWGLHLLGVDPACAARGVGRALVAFAEAHAAANGADRLRLDTPEHHPWLPAFYQRLGYRQTGTVQWEGKRYRSVYLTKSLPPSPQGLRG
ncbi:MAG: GNAT family N-acetyltransferase [Candidatus Sericytochromatia bacterium]